MLSFPVKPMLLQTASEPFDSPNHVFEWKVDGIRCIMFYDNGQIRLQSRTGKDCTRQFPELLEPEVSVKETVFDGEITILTSGKPDFGMVMERYLAGTRCFYNLGYFLVGEQAGNWITFNETQTVIGSIIG